MTLHQSGKSNSTIKIIGQWLSNAFLIYLQGQVATFTKALSVAMKQVMWPDDASKTLAGPSVVLLRSHTAQSSGRNVKPRQAKLI